MKNLTDVSSIGSGFFFFLFFFFCEVPYSSMYYVYLYTTHTYTHMLTLTHFSSLYLASLKGKKKQNLGTLCEHFRYTSREMIYPYRIYAVLFPNKAVLSWLVNLFYIYIFFFLIHFFFLLSFILWCANWYIFLPPTLLSSLMSKELDWFF